MTKQLVFDIGAHQGLDTWAYLRAGFRVVAVEPHPQLVPEIRDLNSCYIALPPLESCLTIVPAAITPHGEPAKLYPSSRPNGETHSLYPERVKESDDIPIMVEGTTTTKLFRQYGVPYYMKVDIEGADLVAIRQLHEWSKDRTVEYDIRMLPAGEVFHTKDTMAGGYLPRYLSVELHWDHPDEALEMIALMLYMGYNAFELVQQHNSAGPQTTLPSDCTYLTSAVGILDQWIEGCKTDGHWYDLHAKHKDATNSAP